MDELNIRSAAASDAAAIAAILNDAILHTTASFWTTPRADADIKTALTQAGDAYPWVVAEADGEVVGFAESKPWNPRQAYRRTVEVSIYVIRSHQGRGVGKRLYGDLIERLRTLDYGQALAGIALPNEASTRLHESAGFKPVGIFKNIGHKFGRTISVGYWQLEL